MKLSTKLVLSFSVVILLVGGIGVTFSYINDAVKDQATAESEQAIEEIELAGEMGLQLYQSLTRTQYLLEDQYRQSLSMNFSRSARAKKTLIKNIDESLQKFRSNIDETRDRIQKEPPNFFKDTTSSANVLAMLDKLEKKFSIYSSLVKQLQDLSTQSYEDGKEFFTVTIEPYFRTNLLPLIEKVRAEIQESHHQEIKRLNSQLNWVGYILIFATVGALLIAISITFFLYRSIANPLKKITKAAISIGQGNLSERINYYSHDEFGQLSDTFDHMAESLSKTTVSRDYVDSIIEAMADLLIVTDEEYKITRINTAGVAMLERTEEELLGEVIGSIFNHLPDNIFQEQVGRNIKSGNTVLIGNNDTELPVSISKGTLRNSNGDVDGYVIVASDISSEKEAQQKIEASLKEKEVLLAEIHHRVKNNLAVISGLLQMQQWEAENEQAASALQESQLRVRSIALVHEKLYQSESLSFIQFDRYIQDLLDAISDTYLSADSDINIETELDEIALNVNQAIPCSLLINELVVNAFKYAFKDLEEQGTITVSVSKSADEVTLVVKDDGIGFKDDEVVSNSLGMSLVETLSKQLSGKLEFKNKEGVEVKVVFEAQEVTQ